MSYSELLNCIKVLLEDKDFLASSAAFAFVLVPRHFVAATDSFCYQPLTLKNPKFGLFPSLIQRISGSLTGAKYPFEDY